MISRARALHLRFPISANNDAHEPVWYVRIGKGPRTRIRAAMKNDAGATDVLRSQSVRGQDVEVGRHPPREIGAIDHCVELVAKCLRRIGFRTASARNAVTASSTATAMNTAVQLPVVCLRKAAAGPPRIEPTPCAI